MSEVEDGPQWPIWINPALPPDKRVGIAALQVEAIQPGEADGIYGITFVQDGFGVENWDTYRDGRLPEVGHWLAIVGRQRFPLPVAPSELGLVLDGR